jgi:hypothetical protein
MAAINKSLARNNKPFRTGAKLAGDDGGALLLLPMKTSRLRTRAAPPSCSDFAGSRLARVNPSHHGSDEQVFGAK